MRPRSLLFCIPLLAAAAAAQDLKPIELPKPQTEGGMPLMQALKARASAREFSAEKLPPQTLSNLLWAAWGVNRPDGRRTAPSASNRQEIDIYVALPEGLFLYDAKAHQLQPVVAGDLRGKTGSQAWVSEAALNLVYVADYAKMGKGSDQDKAPMAGADTGFISQNVYLYCASEGLATVVRAGVNRDALAPAMILRPEQKIVLAQTVGFPKK
ncbi:MAG: SagB/ThcOx family dehydrogenase [Acidobacteria bacterium]|nr:SagB/ThcOx family dehydrogenase [Acidobacteriota bacterium]